MFGDILTDEASVLAGSMGMLPVGLARRRRPGPVRADPRLGARHRRARASPTRSARSSARRCCCATRSGSRPRRPRIERAVDAAITDGCRTRRPGRQALHPRHGRRGAAAALVLRRPGQSSGRGCGPGTMPAMSGSSPGVPGGSRVRFLLPLARLAPLVLLALLVAARGFLLSLRRTRVEDHVNSWRQGPLGLGNAKARPPAGPPPNGSACTLTPAGRWRPEVPSAPSSPRTPPAALPSGCGTLRSGWPCGGRRRPHHRRPA